MIDKELADKLEQLAADVREYGFEDARNKWVYEVNVRSPKFDSLIRRPQDYTRLPDTIDINGHTVELGMQKEPEGGQHIFVAASTHSDYYLETSYCTGATRHRMWFKDGLIHSTRKAAAKHGEALASFTRRGE